MSCEENKRKSVKQIFENMDYEHVTENCDVALAWLAQHNYEFCKFAGDHKDPPNVSEITNENEIVKVHHITQLQLAEIIKKSEAQLKVWLSVPVMEKAKLLNRLAAEIDRHATLLSQLEMFCCNIPTKTKSFRLLVDYLRYYAGWASLIEKEFVDYKPYGVCGVSVDTTCSLGALGVILAPALAAGNSVIVSVNFRFAPVAVFIAELCKNVGFPDGVINVVVSDTLPSLETTKTAILQHVWSQRNTELQVNSNHSFTVLHVGHSSMIVFDNADVDSVCDKICETAWPHRAMFPWGVTKLLVHEPIFKEFLTMLASKLHKLRVGHNARAKSLDIVLPQEGNVSATVELVNGLPVIIGNTEFGRAVITSEAGDVTLSVTAFRTANEAAALANNSRFGFAASVWTESISLANEMTAKLKMGLVWINTHGHIESNASFTPYKDSGLGYFGGPEGLLEYLTYNKTNDFQAVELKKTDVKSHLPGPVQNRRVLLYYGGAFKKSESGLTECDNEFPNKKDVRNCVEAAKKGYDSWNRQSGKVRGQVLWKLAESSASIKRTALSAKWMEYLYEWAVLCNNTESLVQAGTPSLRIVKESVGVLAVELHTDTNYSLLKLLVAALASGNAVIVLDFSRDMQDFLVEVCKLLSAAGVPAGTLNVLFNPNANCIEHLQTHREVQTYFKLDNKTECHRLGFELKAKCYKHVNFSSRKEILNMVTRNKCVWTNVGESVL